MDYHSGLKRGYTGSFTPASLVRNVKTVKSFCPVSNGALKADIAIAYCMHKCGSVKPGYKNSNTSANIRVFFSKFATMVHQALYFHNP